jgi:hypothetical protein
MGYQMTTTLLAAAAALAMLGVAGAAHAPIDNKNPAAAGCSGSLGTVEVTGQGTATLSFDVALADGVAFQLTNGSAHDALWFDLTGVVGAITGSSYNFTAPVNGSYPTGGQFSGLGLNANGYGQGSFKFGDYTVQVADSINPNQYYGNPGHLTFTLTSAGGSLNLGSNVVNGVTVFGAGDFRQTLANGSIVTGPAGFTLDTNTNNGVPEPGTWALMITGFGGVGALMRRRRMALAAI